MSTEEIIELLVQNGDAVRAAKMKRYMRGKFEFLGISSHKRKILQKPLILSARKMVIGDIIALIDDLWDMKFREFQLVALDVMIDVKTRFHGEHIEHVEKWITHQSWWDTVDAIASHIVGEIALKEVSMAKSSIDRWLRSDDIWLNRTCLLYQLKYRRGVDLKRLFYYINVLNSKQEFFIQKAIGWSLRQASKFYPEEIKAFLMESSDIQGLARREASKYLK